ncbi:Polyribonucleotide nucleotidyltransferase [subsurface metagenome]
MVEAMERAKAARLEILEIMAKTISEPRPELSVYAPKLTTIEIDPEFIGKVIGPGGKIIKGIQEQTGTTIEVEEDGTIYISCLGGDGHLRARDIIESITQPPQVGRIYDQSKVVSVIILTVYANLSSAGLTRSSARSARAPCPISLRPGPRCGRISPTEKGGKL